MAIRAKVNVQRTAKTTRFSRVSPTANGRKPNNSQAIPRIPVAITMLK